VGRVPLTDVDDRTSLLVVHERNDPIDLPSAGPGALVQRGGWTLAWFGVLTAGLGFWSAWTSWPGAAVLAPLLVVVGIVGISASWLVANPSVGVLPWAGLAVATLTVGIPQAVSIHVRRYYTTDSAAFNQLATRALLHGKDPYETSMASAANLLNPPSHFWTYLANGGHITQVSYPAGSFLLETPAMALGFHHELADWTDLVAWLVAGVLLFFLLPVGLRWLAILVFMAASFVGTFSAGGTDALFIPFLIVAVWRWDRFGTGRGAGVAGWIGPVALGLACAVKQTPWFCLPLLLIGLGIEATRRGEAPWRVPARYLLVVVGVFAACNLPFVIWGPRAWADSVLLPFSKPLVADGQGLVTVALHGLTGGVVLPLLSVAAALAYVALLAAFVVWYPALKLVWLFVLPLVLLVPGRSFSSYLIDFFPAALVAAVSVLGVPRSKVLDTGSTVRRWVARSAVVVPVLGAAAVCVVAFTSAPLDISVVAVHTSQATLRLDSVTVTVHNSTGQQVIPHFLVDTGDQHPMGFWSQVTPGGQLELPPGGTATVLLRPDEFTWSPPHGSHWLVEAYTASPNALSTSPLQVWSLGHQE
jgi:uncharacterized membrane protein